MAESEKALTKRLFGNLDGSSSPSEESEPEEIVGDEEEGEEPREQQIPPFQQFPIDVNIGNKRRRRPAWHDTADDDHGEEKIIVSQKRRLDGYPIENRREETINPSVYKKRLRQTFLNTSGNKKNNWASSSLLQHPKVSDASSEDDEMTTATKSLVRATGSYLSKSPYLPIGNLGYKKLRDPTFGHRSKGAVNVVQFHRSRQVLMVAGEGSRLSLFQMGLPIEEDAFLQQVKFEQFPISSATFSMDGSRLIAGSRSHPFLYSYDLITGQSTQIPIPKVIVKQNMGRFILSPNTDASYMAMLGKYGEIHLMNANSMEYLKALKMPGRVTCATFSASDNTKLYTFGDQGKVFIWDLRQQALLHSFFDDGAVRGSSLAISKDGAYLACGSNTGIVNIYEGDVVHKTDTPRPFKVVNNLTTSVDHMAFNPDSQMLAISSKVQNCAVRLVHLASRTIFGNFPSRNDKICHSTAIDFSPNGGYMAMGNDRGHTLLYRLYHYPEY